MKGCVLFTIVWFIICVEKGAASTSAPPETSSVSEPPETANVSEPTETSSVSKPTETANVSEPTKTAIVSEPTETSSVSKPTETANVSEPTETSSVSKPTETANVSEPTETSSVSKPTETSSVSKPTETSSVSEPPETSSVSEPPETSSVSKPTETSSVSKPTETANVSKPTKTAIVSEPTETSSVSKPTETANVSEPTEVSSASMPTESMNASTPTSTTAGILTPSGPPTCADQPCEYAVACIDLFQDFLCQCPYGFYYKNTSGCQQGKVFAGEFTLTQQYVQDMENTQSKVYADFYHHVTNLFSGIFKDEKSYRETIIVSIKPSLQASKRLSKAEAASTINVTLINLFDTNTNVTLEVWMKKVNSSGNITLDQNLSQCAVYGCDGSTTTCRDASDASGLSHPICECHSGLAKKNPEDKACLLCKSTECSPEKNQYCFMTAENVPECRCQSGFQKEGDKCQECAFGYSGEDCKEVYLAALVGVAVACGVVLMVLTGVLIHQLIRRNKEPSLERRSLLQNDHSAKRETKGNGSYSNSAVKQSMFPRVQAGNPAGVARATTANQGGNLHEAGAANKAYVPERDYDDDNPWLEMSPRDRF